MWGSSNKTTGQNNGFCSLSERSEAVNSIVQCLRKDHLEQWSLNILKRPHISKECSWYSQVIIYALISSAFVCVRFCAVGRLRRLFGACNYTAQSATISDCNWHAIWLRLLLTCISLILDSSSEAIEDALYERTLCSYGGLLYTIAFTSL